MARKKGVGLNWQQGRTVEKFDYEVSTDRWGIDARAKKKFEQSKKAPKIPVIKIEVPTK